MPKTLPQGSSDPSMEEIVLAAYKLGDGESLEDCVAVSESVSAALLSTGILPCDAEISDVENAFLDAQLVRRRRQFTAVLTVEVGDCLLMEPGGGA